MDNVARYGFRAFEGRNAPLHSLSRPMVVATGYQASPGGTDVDLHIGDPVRRLADGSIALAVAGDDLYGAIVGFNPYWDGTRMQPTSYLPGGTVWGTIEARRSEALVVPFSAAIWEIDADDTVNQTEAAYRALAGANADLSLSADATLKKAFPKLDVSDIKTATAQLRVWAVSPTKENRDFTGANVKMLVVANETQEAPFVTAGI